MALVLEQSWTSLHLQDAETRDFAGQSVQKFKKQSWYKLGQTLDT